MKTFIEEINLILYSSIPNTLPNINNLVNIKKRNLLIFVNPFGGKRNADSVYNTIVLPMFERARLFVNVTKISTQYAGHANDFIQTVDYRRYDGILSLSGK